MVAWISYVVLITSRPTFTSTVFNPTQIFHDSSQILPYSLSSIRSPPPLDYISPLPKHQIILSKRLHHASFEYRKRYHAIHFPCRPSRVEYPKLVTRCYRHSPCCCYFGRSYHAVEETAERVTRHFFPYVCFACIHLLFPSKFSADAEPVFTTTT